MIKELLDKYNLENEEVIRDEIKNIKTPIIEKGTNRKYIKSHKCLFCDFDNSNDFGDWHYHNGELVCEECLGRLIEEKLKGE